MQANRTAAWVAATLFTTAATAWADPVAPIDARSQGATAAAAQQDGVLQQQHGALQQEFGKRRSRRGEPAHTSLPQEGPRRDGMLAGKRVARVAPKPPCLRDGVELERGFGGARQSIVLTTCDGRPAPHAVEQLSILARPLGAPQPVVVPTTPVLHAEGPRHEWLPWVKLVDDGLITRLQRVVDHFHAKRLIVVSGYRPESTGSYHQSAKALDFRVDGVRNEALVAFCRTLPDTGCGYYPNSSFVHLDVRPEGTGHAYWIDVSGPGEGARYVSSWPPPVPERGRDARMVPSIPAIPFDEHTHSGFLPQLPAASLDRRIDVRTLEPATRSNVEDDPFHP